MKVLIHPNGTYGGVPQYVKNVKKFSKNELTLFHYYIHPFSIRSIKAFSYLLHNLKIENIDPIGLFFSKCVFPNKFDIVHLNGHPWCPELYKKGPTKYIHTVHQVYMREDFIVKGQWEFWNWLNKLLFKSCKESDIVISVAKWQQKILDKHGIDSVFIPNAVNVEECEKGNAERFKEKYGINDEFALFGGDIRWYKRPNLFIELAERNPDKLFVMKGRGMKREIIKRRFGLDVTRNLICLGELPFQDVLDAVAASKILILTSKNDTFPTVLLEAMALKKVVVGADNAGPKEIITDGKDGFLFKPDNIDDLEKKTLLAWENPELGKNGYKKVKDQFDWKVVIKSIDTVYDDLMTK